MTASISVLSPGSGGASAVASYYLSLTTPTSYYTESAEPPGIWHGKLARQLGLKGCVGPAAFRNLLAGKSPDGRRQLVKPQKSRQKTVGNKNSKKQIRAEHVPGVDITFSLPKSVSAVWAVVSEKDRRRIEDLAIRAIKQGLTTLVSEVPLAREGKRGQIAKQADIAAAIFRHSTSRSNHDPQLHFHVVIPNVVRKANGQFAKLNTLLLHQWTRTLGPLLRNNLATLLQAKMGFELIQPVTKDGKVQGWFEIQGVPEKLCQHWSSRSREIGELADLMTAGSTSAKAKQAATLKSRQTKTSQPPTNELREKWQTEAKRFGFDRQQAESLMNRQEAQRPLSRDFDQAFNQALETLTSQHAHFEKRKLYQHVSEKLQTSGFNASEIIQKIKRELTEQTRVMTLTNGKRELFTTPEMWKVEESLISQVGRLKSDDRLRVPASLVEKVIAQHPSLSTEQQDAVRHLTTGKGRIQTLVGVAGSGKSQILGAVRAIYEAAGLTVLGAALSGAAKEELANKSGIPSRTLASYLYHFGDQESSPKDAVPRHKPQLTNKTIMVIDEAGMVGSRMLEKLLGYIEKSGARVILTGDSKQLPPIEAGGPFQHITKEVKPAELKESRRQLDANDRKSAELIREGKISEALQDYAERGKLVVSETRTEAAKRLVADWANSGADKKPQTAIILTQTRADAEDINRICQFDRLMKGLISNKSTAVDGQTFHENDRVMFHKALRSKGIENGFRATLVSINRLTKSVIVQLDKGHSARSVGHDRPQQVKLTFQELAELQAKLAYAATTHKMQGQTVDRCFVLLGGSLSSQEMTYVQMTRARKETKLYVDRIHAGKELEQLPKDLAKSLQKEMAHEIKR